MDVSNPGSSEIGCAAGESGSKIESLTTSKPAPHAQGIAKVADASKRPNHYTTVATNEHVGRGADVFDIAQAFGLNGPLTMALNYLIRFQHKGNPEDARKARHCLERAEELKENRSYHVCDHCEHYRSHHDTRLNRFGGVCRVPECNCEKYERRF